jgi:hypothetical protein
MQARRRDQAGWRLPGEELEATVIAAIRDFLNDHHRLCEIMGPGGREEKRAPKLLDR